MLHRTLPLTASLLALTSLAGAQSINIDFGPAAPFGKPLITHGAAAFQAGQWNQVAGNAGPYGGALGGAIVDTAGQGTAVQVRLTAGADAFCDFVAGCNGAGPAGSDAEALMDDHARFSGPCDLLIRGLDPGLYTYYVYAWAPDDANARTTVDGVPVGGAWGGGQIAGATYATKSMIPVAAGIPLKIKLDGAAGSLNGIQLVKELTPVGTSYCPAQPNSTGVGAGLIAVGSPSALENFFYVGASGIPRDSFAMLATGPQQANLPGAGGSQGTLCLGGPIGRFTRPSEILRADPVGNVFMPVDLTDFPTPNARISVTPGTTVYFQIVYRDVDPTTGAATSNFTDALCMTFQ